jgi:hypothetical protein
MGFLQHASGQLPPGPVIRIQHGRVACQYTHTNKYTNIPIRLGGRGKCWRVA